MSLNAELIIACFQQQSDKISSLIENQEKQDKQNAEFKEIIAKQAEEIAELKKKLKSDSEVYSWDFSYLDGMNRSVSQDIAQLKKTQEKQEKKMKKQERKIEDQNQVIYQLLGGLFDQRTQAGILDMHLSSLNGECTNENVYIRDTSIWRHYPTTRQGDESERRIDVILQQRDESERRIDVIEKTLMNIGRIISEEPEPELWYEEEAQTEEDLLVQHMKKIKEENYFGHFQNLERELEEKKKVIEELTEKLEMMKEETAISESSTITTISVKRMRNTFDLCGNE